MSGLVQADPPVRFAIDSLEVRQLWVNRMVAAEPRLRCVARHPHWTREGYVEELFLPTGTRP